MGRVHDAGSFIFVMRPGDRRVSSLRLRNFPKTGINMIDDAFGQMVKSIIHSALIIRNEVYRMRVLLSMGFSC